MVLPGLLGRNGAVVEEFQSESDLHSLSMALQLFESCNCVHTHKHMHTHKS